MFRVFSPFGFVEARRVGTAGSVFVEGTPPPTLASSWSVGTSGGKEAEGGVFIDSVLSLLLEFKFYRQIFYGKRMRLCCCGCKIVLNEPTF